MDVNDLRRERAALVKDGKRLLDAVETKRRALTDEEKRTDDARADKIAALGIMIDEIEAADRDAKHARLHRAESKRLRARAYTIQVRPEE
jgi:hypothetical protein